MGFLMGAFGKLMAGKRLRNLQFKLTQVTQQHSRITKQISLFEKQQQSQRKNIQASMQAQMQNYTYLQMGGLLGMQDSDAIDRLNNGTLGQDIMSLLYNSSNPAASGTKIDSNAYQAFAIAQQNSQMRFAMATQMWDQLFEMQSESLLQPLRDAEESLQTEKDSLESQIKIAQADYDAQKEQEKAGAKNIAPDYTGQG